MPVPDNKHKAMSLIRAFVSQRGILGRVAKQLRFDPSYVSRVARGERKSEVICHAIASELNKIQTTIRDIERKASKKIVSRVSK